MISRIFFLLLFNVPTLIGVIFFQWSVPEILLIYWLENIIAGCFYFWKMKKVKQYTNLHKNHENIKEYIHTQKNMKNKSKLQPAQTAKQMIQDWKRTYIAFSVGHGFFVILLAIVLWGLNSENLQTLGVVLLLLCIDYTIAYNFHFLNKKEYQIVTVEALIRNAKMRLVILHLTIIFGVLAASLKDTNQYWFVVILIALKIGTELLSANPYFLPAETK